MSNPEAQNPEDDRPVFQRDPKKLLGTIVGEKYETLEYLGGGGYGEVYKARNIHMKEQRVVIKFLKHVEARDRFLNEAKLLCQVDHPNICRIIDYLPVEGALVIQFIDGKDCGELMEKHGTLEAKDILKISRAIAEALAFAHKRHIAHRDVKPRNIMVDRNGHVYLIDFGIAKALDATSLTGTGRPPYTPRYAAPERQDERPYNPYLSDIYEAGATILELATRRTPGQEFHGHKMTDKTGARKKTLSRQFRSILKEATQQAPADRYQSAESLLQDLDRVKSVYRRPHLLSLSSLMLLVLIVITSLIWPNEITRTYYSLSSYINDLLASGSSSTVPREVNKPVEDSIDSNLSATPPMAIVDSSNKIDPSTIPAAKTEQIEERSSQGKLTVNIEPRYNTTLILDDEETSQGQQVPVEFGSHSLTVTNPEYPMVVRQFRMTADKELMIDLEQEFADADTVLLVIGGSSLPQTARLRVTLNGKQRTYYDLPVMNLGVLRGRWAISMAIIREGLPIRLDSAVTFPHGGGPRVKLDEGKAILDFSDHNWRGLSRADIKLFWSEE